MKMNKKKVFVIALAITLIAILSFGTLAWFNDTDSVVNNFYVATDEEGEPDFSVDIWEPVDKDGDGVIEEDEKEQVGQNYHDIVPGGRYDKEPTIENTGYYGQYIRAMITIDDASEWMVAMQNIYPNYDEDDLRELFAGINADNWDEDGFFWNGANLTYVYYYIGEDGVLDEDESVVLFTHVDIPGALTQGTMDMLGGSTSIVVSVDAIQADAIVEYAERNHNWTIKNAKDAFEYVEWEAGDPYTNG